MSLSLALLGGLLALDATSVGQFMFSRPLVAGTLAGWLLGDAGLGLQVGAILELFHLAGVPAGGSRVPESGPASVVAVAVAMAAAGPAGLALGLVAGLAVSELGGMTVSWHRHMVARVLGRTDPRFMTAGKLAAVHISSVLMDFVRGAVVTAAGLVVGGWLSGFLASRWPLPYETTVALILIGASVHLGALLRGFGGWKNRRAVFLVGLVAGIVGAYL
ncbi:MAG: PTS sugar transporter subunit IIC [Gemmatimonadetes bacterium]|nr:PTS sugar transporter subunit IIC [Gemmatimonadota bacterium]